MRDNGLPDVHRSSPGVLRCLALAHALHFARYFRGGCTYDTARCESGVSRSRRRRYFVARAWDGRGLNEFLNSPPPPSPRRTNPDVPEPTQVPVPTPPPPITASHRELDEQVRTNHTCLQHPSASGTFTFYGFIAVVSDVTSRRRKSALRPSYLADAWSMPISRCRVFEVNLRVLCLRYPLGHEAANVGRFDLHGISDHCGLHRL